MRFLLVAVNAKYIHSNPAIYSLRAYAGRRQAEIHSEMQSDTPSALQAAVELAEYTINQQLQDILADIYKRKPDAIGFSCYIWNWSVIQELLREIPKLLPGTDLWLGGLASFKNKIIYYESSRGCPYRCSYCLSSLEKKLRLRNPDIVKRELQFFLDTGVKQVKFIDRTFNCNHEHAMLIWNYILEHDNGVTNFHFEIAADILREEVDLLHKMRPGLVQLEIGVQSVNPHTIKEINRVMDVDHLEQIVASIDAGKNIHQHLDLIAGLPYEDYESFAISFDRVYHMHPEQLQLGFLKVLKGSYMEEQAAEYGLVYMDRAPYEVLYTRWLSYEDVLQLKKIEEMVEIYYNSNQFTHTLPALETCFESPFRMFEELARFYEEKGFFTESPARAYRYQVLLDFILEKDPARQAVYRELLTYDMYLRENLKSRPSFAPDLRDRADIAGHIREFFRKEEQQRKYLPDYQKYDWKQLSKMTHMEPFTYPVWKTGREVFRKGAIGYVLFDYKNRNPLTYEAGTEIFEELPQ